MFQGFCVEALKGLGTMTVDTFPEFSTPMPAQTTYEGLALPVLRL